MNLHKWKKAAAIILAVVLALPTVSYVNAEETSAQEETAMPVENSEPVSETKPETEPQSIVLETEQLAELETQPASSESETEQPVETETQAESSGPKTEQPVETETQAESNETVTEDFTDGTETETSQPEELTDNPVSESVKAVQALIEELPDVEELSAMSIEEQQEVYEKLQTAYDAYFALSDEEKAFITGAEIFETLFAFFYSGISTLAEDAGDFIVTGGISGTDWIYDSGSNTLTFKNSGTYTVEGNGQETQEQINVDANFVGTITIKGINAKKMDINATAQLTVMLEGTNTLREGLKFPVSNGTLTIDSKTNGSLSATSNDGAGIGGINSSGGNITINGGTVIATGNDGAGIGGGYGYQGRNITINGGTVIATGNRGAGIGGGMSNEGSNITINGGTVIATSTNGAGIGGAPSNAGSNITITGGNVTANGGNGGAGIGGGRRGSGNNITISGGTVTATGSDGGAGIGGGNTGGSASNIKITDGSVKASSIGTTPTDGQDQYVYLVKIENLSGIDTVTVDQTSTYTRNGNHPNDDGAFYLYLTGENHTISAGNKTYEVYWDNEAQKFKLSNPNTPAVAIDTKTASSITIQPLEQQEIYGTAEYSLNGTDWQASNIFTDLHSAGYGGNYTIYARYKGNDSYLQSEVGTISISTNAASYTITIPKTAQAGSGSVNIEVEGQKLDLGYNGQVNVKVKNGGVVSAGGIVTLTRQNDPDSKTITSAMYVNGTAFTDITKNVATFKTIDDAAVPVSFAAPAETEIEAGEYSGTITFEISYSEP